jgi:hypothetical protein
MARRRRAGKASGERWAEGGTPRRRPPDQASMMTGVMSRVRREDGEQVPLRAAAARRRKSTSGGDARGPSAWRACRCAGQAGSGSLDRAALVHARGVGPARGRCAAAADLGAGSVQRAGPTRRASGKRWAEGGAPRPPQPILRDAGGGVPGTSRGRQAGAFASGDRGAARVDVGKRCQGAQCAARVMMRRTSEERHPSQRGAVHAAACGVGSARRRCAAAAGLGGGRRSGREADGCEGGS